MADKVPWGLTMSYAFAGLLDGVRIVHVGPSEEDERMLALVDAGEQLFVCVLDQP